MRENKIIKCTYTLGQYFFLFVLLWLRFLWKKQRVFLFLWAHRDEMVERKRASSILSCSVYIRTWVRERQWIKFVNFFYCSFAYAWTFVLSKEHREQQKQRMRWKLVLLNFNNLSFINCAAAAVLFFDFFHIYFFFFLYVFPDNLFFHAKSFFISSKHIQKFLSRLINHWWLGVKKKEKENEVERFVSHAIIEVYWIMFQKKSQTFVCRIICKRR